VLILSTTFAFPKLRSPIGIPSDVTHLVNFTKSMLSLNTSLSSTPSNPAPILVGCSAGVGRTGTFMTIASLLPLISGPFPSLLPLPPTPTDHPLGPYPSDKIEQLGVTPRDFVGLTIDGLREQRCTMVQTHKQVMFCFEALKEAWKQEHEA
jgi:protein-tyrosine phosphatase